MVFFSKAEVLAHQIELIESVADNLIGIFVFFLHTKSGISNFYSVNEMQR